MPTNLNCSESRLAGPQSASSHTRIAHGERLGGHGVGCTTHFSALGVHVRPARSIFSNALNLCRSAIASFVRSPWRYCPTRLLCRPAKGHAAAAPPRSVMNWRRLRSGMGSSPEPAVLAYGRLRMPRKLPQVLGVDLNRSESRGRADDPMGVLLVTRGDAKMDYRRFARACERDNPNSRHLPSPCHSRL